MQYINNTKVIKSKKDKRMKKKRGIEQVRIQFKFVGEHVARAANTDGKKLLVHSMLFTANVTTTNIKIKSNGIQVFGDIHLKNKGEFIMLPYSKYAWFDCASELTIISDQIITGFVTLTEQ